MQDTIAQSIVLHNQLVKEMEEIYRLYAKKSGVSETAFWILYCVRERKEPYTQKELCDLWSYSRQTINSALKNMQAQGLIRLALAEGNRKNKQILLTSEGKELVKRVIDPLMQAEQNTFAQLGMDNVEQYLQLERRHVQALRKQIEGICAFHL